MLSSSLHFSNNQINGQRVWGGGGGGLLLKKNQCKTNGMKDGNVLFHDAINTFYLQLYGVTHVVKDDSDSERGNLLPPNRLLFPISSKGSFISIIPRIG